MASEQGASDTEGSIQYTPPVGSVRHTPVGGGSWSVDVPVDAHAPPHLRLAQREHASQCAGPLSLGTQVPQ